MRTHVLSTWQNQPAAVGTGSIYYYHYLFIRLLVSVCRSVHCFWCFQILFQIVVPTSQPACWSLSFCNQLFAKNTTSQSQTPSTLFTRNTIAHRHCFRSLGRRDLSCIWMLASFCDFISLMASSSTILLFLLLRLFEGSMPNSITFYCFSFSTDLWLEGQTGYCFCCCCLA